MPILGTLASLSTRSFGFISGVSAPVYGCTDPNATNYNPNATVNNGTCTYPPPPTVDVFWTVVRSASNQNSFYINGNELACEFDGQVKTVSTTLNRNQLYQITANVSNLQLSGGWLGLEDSDDGDYNDLQITPNQGSIYDLGGTYYFAIF